MQIKTHRFLVVAFVMLAAGAALADGPPLAVDEPTLAERIQWIHTFFTEVAFPILILIAGIVAKKKFDYNEFKEVARKVVPVVKDLVEDPARPEIHKGKAALDEAMRRFEKVTGKLGRGKKKLARKAIELAVVENKK